MKFLLILMPMLLLNSCRASADDEVVAKMRELFKTYDGDHNGQMAPEEQRLAVAAVKQTYGDSWETVIKRMLNLAKTADGNVGAADWQKQVDAYAKKPEVETVRIPMRDGIKLATDVYHPQGPGPFPVILSRTPYGRPKKGKDGSGFTAQGYVFVIQDMRGRFDSEGENFPFIGCGWGEHQDGVDTIAWIRKQPWCDGSVATIGGSAGGITQNLLAGAVPEGLKAQFITVAAASMYQDASYIGGAFRKADTENWMTNNKFDARALSLARAHPILDDYWKDFDTARKYSVMNVPAIHVGGWFDMFAQATIDEFVGRQHLGASGSRGTQKLVMGPWTHSIGQMPVGELQFPKAGQPPQYNATRWFNHYLMGETNGIEKEPAVCYYVMGDTSSPGAPGNEWRQADDWPIPAVDTAFYFTSGRGLSTVKPTTTSDERVEFTFDPANPCPTVGGNNLTLERGPMNQNRIESRGDVVLFTAEPLTEPLEVTGRVKAKLFVSSSAEDTDLSVRLCDVYPDGKSYLIAEGILRLRYRESFSEPKLLTPGKVEEVTVDCWSTSTIFNKGHRIRATVTSSNFPRFDLNPGTGKPLSDDGEKVKQTNRIHCDAVHPSCIVLPLPRVGKR